MGGELQMLPRDPPHLRAFLVAHFKWSRYHATRVALVHVLAICAASLLLPLPAWLREPLGVASGASFAAALLAAMMEWRWGRERDRHAADVPPPGAPP